MPLMLATGAARSLAALAHWQAPLPQPVFVDVRAFMKITSLIVEF